MQNNFFRRNKKGLLYILVILLTVSVSNIILAKFIHSVLASTSSNLLSNPWNLSAQSGSAQAYQTVSSNSLNGFTTLRLTYNLHGLCILGGDASAIIFDQPAGGSWHYISLSGYGKNCLNGDQTIDIPLSNFPGLNVNSSVGLFHTRFWYDKPFNITISAAQLINSTQTSPTPTPTKTPVPTTIPSPSPTITPTPIPPTNYPQSWAIQSVSSMKETKDKICGQDNQDFINKWLDKAVELGANYVAIETPYDNPSCGNSLSYTTAWINAARSRGLKIWHRHMPLSFEGIYGVSKSPQNYFDMISNYITNNPNLFRKDDIFTPIPEPQNGGINGITYCAGSVCQFSNAASFNQWLRDAMNISNQAFNSVGLGGQIKIGYYGFDGFVAWGDHNPDWHGILEDATVSQMGNITIDHYPESIGETMAFGLDQLQAKYPNIPIVIGEWGTVTGGNVEQQVKDSMGAAKRSNVVGFNYWHLGMGGNESLINNDFTNKVQFNDVKQFFKP